jgi:hypothetical protein
MDQHAAPVLPERVPFVSHFPNEEGFEKCAFTSHIFLVLERSADDRYAIELDLAVRCTLSLPKEPNPCFCVPGAQVSVSCHAAIDWVRPTLCSPICTDQPALVSARHFCMIDTGHQPQLVI